MEEETYQRRKELPWTLEGKVVVCTLTADELVAEVRSVWPRTLWWLPVTEIGKFNRGEDTVYAPYCCGLEMVEDMTGDQYIDYILDRVGRARREFEALSEDRQAEVRTEYESYIIGEKDWGDLVSSGVDSTFFMYFEQERLGKLFEQKKAEPSPTE